jgi:hypothetical protein
MTTPSTISPTPNVARQAFARTRPVASAPSSARALARSMPTPVLGTARAGSRRRIDLLGRYIDVTGRAREVIAGQRGDGSVLVVDRDALTLGDRRLVAHLAADEPTENAALICACYLQDAHRGRCRRVTAEDLTGRPSTDRDDPGRIADGSEPETVLVGRRDGGDRYAYRLGLAATDGPAVELRWLRHARHGALSASTPVRLRTVIGAIESYEPVCELTLRALARYREDAEVSVAVLGSELERMRESPIVLNRKLRQAVLAAIEHHGLSMSEIAIRCGRVKRDAKGNTSGETSWLARRVGIFAESGATRPTPWVHSDVLALIARNGLGMSPREVEL